MIPLVATCKYDENYLVFSTGDVYNGNLEKLKPYHTNGVNDYQYYMFRNQEDPDSEHKAASGQVCDRQKRRQKKVFVHRLVAEHFMPNPNNLSDVHHIDSNPQNNDISNLMWLSHRDNCRLKEPPDPLLKIKKKPNAYVYHNVGKGYLFAFRTKHPKYNKIQKYFKTQDEAIKFRDNYFAVA